MSGSPSVTTWIGKLKSGEPEAAQQLWERYFERLVRLAHDRLRGVPQQVSDEEDVALSAFHSFCQAVAKRRFPQLNNRDDLWRLLVMHVVQKAADQRRYHQSIKRGGGRAVQRGDSALEDVVGTEPDPQMAAMVVEEFQAWLNRLDDAELRRIAVRKMEGYTNAEIAKEFNYNLRSIERKLAVIRNVWREANEA